MKKSIESGKLLAFFIIVVCFFMGISFGIRENVPAAFLVICVLLFICGEEKSKELIVAQRKYICSLVYIVNKQKITKVMEELKCEVKKQDN